MHQSKGFEHPKEETVACSGEDDLESVDLEEFGRGDGFRAASGSCCGMGPGPGAKTDRSTGYPRRPVSRSARATIPNESSAQPATARDRAAGASFRPAVDFYQPARGKQRRHS